ncbi:MAG: serine hydrolase [Rhodopila sp.]
MLHAGPGGSAGQSAEQPDLFLFTASAYKTFVLGQYLRDVEAGRLSKDEQVLIDDSVRMIGSPVFLNLTGTTTVRSVLEAMITHSDNIATNIATMKVGADRVRALIVQAGLQSIRIPDSTPRFFPTFSMRLWAWISAGPAPYPTPTLRKSLLQLLLIPLVSVFYCWPRWPHIQSKLLPRTVCSRGGYHS